MNLKDDLCISIHHLHSTALHSKQPFTAEATLADSLVTNKDAYTEQEIKIIERDIVESSDILRTSSDGPGGVVEVEHAIETTMPP